jgi:hypothetical protein
MNIKRFLVPVLALAAFVLPASADVIAYCDGFGCGSNTTAAFTSAVTADGDTYASISNITFTDGSLTGVQYDDGLTSVIFQNSTHAFTINSGELDTSISGNDSVTITVPAAYSAIVLNLTNFNSGTVGFGLDGNDFANLSHGSTTTVGYTNIGGTDPWTITIFPFQTNGALGILSFDAAGIVQSQAPPTGSDTPEVGTLLLIGAGLIAMRWMKRAPRRFFQAPQIA